MLKHTREFRSSKGKERETSVIPSSAKVQDPVEPEIDLSLDEKKIELRESFQWQKGPYTDFGMLHFFFDVSLRLTWKTTHCRTFPD